MPDGNFHVHRLDFRFLFLFLDPDFLDLVHSILQLIFQIVIRYVLQTFFKLGPNLVFLCLIQCLNQRLIFNVIPVEERVVIFPIKRILAPFLPFAFYLAIGFSVVFNNIVPLFPALCISLVVINQRFYSDDDCRSHPQPATCQSPYGTGKLAYSANTSCSDRSHLSPGSNGRFSYAIHSSAGKSCSCSYFTHSGRLNRTGLYGRSIYLGVSCRHGAPDGRCFLSCFQLSLGHELCIDGSFFGLCDFHGLYRLVIGLFFFDSSSLYNVDPFRNSPFLSSRQCFFCSCGGTGRPQDSAYRTTGSLKGLKGFIDSNESHDIPSNINDFLFIAGQEFGRFRQPCHNVRQIGFYNGCQCCAGSKADPVRLHLKCAELFGEPIHLFWIQPDAADFGSLFLGFIVFPQHVRQSQTFRAQRIQQEFLLIACCFRFFIAVGKGLHLFVYGDQFPGRIRQGYTHRLEHDARLFRGIPAACQGLVQLHDGCTGRLDIATGNRYRPAEQRGLRGGNPHGFRQIMDFRTRLHSSADQLGKAETGSCQSSCPGNLAGKAFHRYRCRVESICKALDGGRFEGLIDLPLCVFQFAVKPGAVRPNLDQKVCNRRHFFTVPSL